jgi:NDP-hexose-3-ketoreductase
METTGSLRSAAPYRLGVLGCSAIVPRAILEPLRHVEGIEIAALANRTYGKAERMAAAYGISRVADSLQALIDDETIDAVYIALSNELHAEWAQRALQAGKHVLVEKPLCQSAEEAEQLRRAYAASNGLVLEEGLMVRHHPWQAALAQLVRSGKYGALRRIESRITITAKDGFKDNYRSDKTKGGGSFLDLGCYWLQFLQSQLGLDWSGFRGESEFAGPGGCDWTFRAQADYKDGVEAVCLTSFEMPYKACHRLWLDDAILTVPDFFRANLGFYKITIRTERSAETVQPIVFEPMNYYVNQLQAFRDMMAGRESSALADALERSARLKALIEDAERRHAGPLPTTKGGAMHW